MVINLFSYALNITNWLTLNKPISNSLGLQIVNLFYILVLLKFYVKRGGTFCVTYLFFVCGVVVLFAIITNKVVCTHWNKFVRVVGF